MRASPSVQTVLIMAGGTGGHVFPALAVAAALRKQSLDVQWLGTARGIEARLVPEHGISLHCLSVQGLRGKGPLTRLQAVFKAAASVVAAIGVIRKIKPICVIGLGGYVAGPGGLAAWLLRKPLLIHEQNAVAGTTNRLLARFARRVLTGYPIALGGERNCYIGNPVRESIAALPEPDARYGDRTGPLRLLVLGGSQGARAINERVLELLARISGEAAVSVWHQTGAAHIEHCAAYYASLECDVKVEAFIEDMAAAYAWADVVLCRAGALTVAELTAAGVASWLVPLPQAIDNHQFENARWLRDNGAGDILEQAALSADVLCARLACQRADLLTMARAARRLAMPDAAERAAAYCREFAYV